MSAALAAALQRAGLFEQLNLEDIHALALRDLGALEQLVDDREEQLQQHEERALSAWIEIGAVLTAVRHRHLTRAADLYAWAKERWGWSDREIRNYTWAYKERKRVSAVPPGVGIRGLRAAVKAALKEEGHAPAPVAIVPEASLPEDVVLVVGDAACLDEIEDGSVDLVVTSPPYDLGLDYGPGIDDALGRNAYLDLARRWAQEWWRKAAPQGRLCLNVPLDTAGETGPRPAYADWVRVLGDVGWHYRTTIVWAEGNVSQQRARGSVDSPSAPHVIAPVEMVIVAHKGEWNLSAARRTHPAWGQPDLLRAEWLDWTSGLWAFPGTSVPSWHTAPFPEELPRRLIKLFSFPGALVLDPFLGSGTSAVVAARLGRRFYGVDRNPEFVARARQRVAAA